MNNAKNLNYYLLMSSTVEDIGEVYPQCKGVPKGYTFNFYDRPNSMTKLNSFEFPNFEPELIFELEEDALVTNVISPSNIMATGLLLDQKLKKILDVFDLCEHKYFNAEILGTQDTQYYWLHLQNNSYSSLDFNSSSFYSGYHFNTKLETLCLKSSEDLRNCLENSTKQEVPYFIFLSELKLSKEYSNLDLVFYPNISMGQIIISEKLKNAIELEEITGVEIVEI